MKRSEQPTPHIMILADSASEWDNCDFAIIHITEEWQNVMRRRLTKLERFADDDDFCSLRYWDSPVGFYQNNHEKKNGIPKDLLKEDEVWCFITFDEGEPDDLILPENRLSTFMLTVYQHETAMYNASGKHTGEEFWTEAFDINQLTVPRLSTTSINTKNE